jgi:hypothetical protein
MRSCIPKTIALIAILLGVCWGCGPSAAVIAPLVSVKGKVTYKGQPLAKGVIRFEPIGGYGRPASGKLQSDGTYVLSTLKDGDGVVAGKHTVYLTDIDAKLGRDRAFRKAMLDLTAEVSPEKNDFTFDLK